ncbi:MAG: hypothetical protein ACKOB5_10335, partial [Betaproteobacteria bacterium]
QRLQVQAIQGEAAMRIGQVGCARQGQGHGRAGKGEEAAGVAAAGVGVKADVGAGAAAAAPGLAALEGGVRGPF